MGCSFSSSKSAVSEGKYVVPNKDRLDEEKQLARRMNTEYIGTLQALNNVPLLRRLPKDQHPILAACCIAQVFQAGDTVIQQGKVGEEFFLIRSGQASVFIADDGGCPKYVATVKPGDYFGETALLHDEPRNATITAETELKTLKITRDKFQELGLHTRLEFAKRGAVCAQMTLYDSPNASASIPLKRSLSAPEKSTEDHSFIATNLQKNDNLQTLGIDADKAGLLADVAWSQDIAEGEQVIEQEDEKADYLYVVASGAFDCFVMDKAVEREETPLPTCLGARMGDPASKGVKHLQPIISATTQREERARKVGSVASGGCFGELALMYSVPRAATVQATVNSKVWVIGRSHFKKVFLKASDSLTDTYAELLDGVEIFDSLLQDEKRTVAESMTEMSFTMGEVVVQQGEQGDALYILYDGDVEVIKDGQHVNTLKASRKPPVPVAHCFGDIALLNNEPRAATVRVASVTAKALTLDRASFEGLLGAVGAIRNIISEPNSKGQCSFKVTHSGNGSLVSAGRKREGGPERIDDLALIGVLGVGAFGKVELRQDEQTFRIYAVKIMSKGYIVKRKMQQNVVNEKHIMESVDSPFIIKLYSTMNTAQWLHFCMEPALGGELFVIYHRKCFHGSIQHARYYTASVVLALEHLHDRHVIYRDLKPENLLLSSKGILKLTDMGLAKFAIGKTYTTCGTPDYFAPEVIQSSGQTRAVDWWTLGVLLFEFMTGAVPFKGESELAMYGKVLKGINAVAFPQGSQGATEDLVKRLLERDAMKRLPMRHGVQSLKNHNFYKDFNWEGLSNETLKPVYLPLVKHPTDLSQFLHVRHNKVHWAEWKDDGSDWDKDL